MDEWEFDEETCCREMEVWMKWEFERMMREDMTYDPKANT